MSSNSVYVASKLVQAFNFNGVIIKGGTGLTSTNLITRDYAVITELSKDDYASITDPQSPDGHAFLKMVKNGSMSVVAGNSEGDAYKAISELSGLADKSMPVQQGDLDKIADKQGESAGVALLLNEQGVLTDSQLTDGLVERSKKAKAA